MAAATPPRRRPAIHAPSREALTHEPPRARVCSRRVRNVFFNVVFLALSASATVYARARVLVHVGDDIIPVHRAMTRAPHGPAQ